MLILVALFAVSILSSITASYHNANPSIFFTGEEAVSDFALTNLDLLTILLAPTNDPVMPPIINTTIDSSTKENPGFVPSFIFKLGLI